MPETTANNLVGRAVLVTTKYRGVFFGLLDSYAPPVAGTEGGTAVLLEARNCLSWPSEVRGFLGLATLGPLDGSRVGPAVSLLKLEGVSSIAECSDEAAELWRQGPWS